MRRSRSDHPLAGVPGSDIYKAERSPERLRGVPGSAPIFKPTPAERASAAIARLASRWVELRDSVIEEVRQATGQPAGQEPESPSVRAIVVTPRPGTGPGRELDGSAARRGPETRGPAPAPMPPAHAGPRLDAQPARRLAIVTCMDPRVDALQALGLSAGDAHVLRNAGGIVTDDVIRSLAVSQRRLHTREIVLIQHTDCGMQRLDAEHFRAELQADAGIAPPPSLDVGALKDLDEEMRLSILRVQRSPFLPHRDRVRGYIYDVRTHRMREIRVM